MDRLGRMAQRCMPGQARIAASARPHPCRPLSKGPTIAPTRQLQPPTRKKTVRADGRELAARVHIGDAPMDVQAAADAGALPLGVLTGIYTEEQLRAAEPTSVILPDLTDLDEVMDVLLNGYKA